MATQFRAAESLPTVPVGDGARGDDPLLPGEAEYRAKQERTTDGIPLPPRVVDALTDLAADLDIETPFAGEK